ncbi:MAG: putative MerR family transcriptional regulator [Ilumatobacteraceae bacterium]|nr:putative MerR family transcriptional regulator [Ilumatobacteraceae bacterium]
MAEASGFTAATLRYYEQIGLLAPSARTPAGYRTYDERTLERLAFIARAKQLGCSLEEIVGLATAWDGGRCGPVQDQLRTLVADKIVAAQTQIAELVTFASELQSAAASLERHRPEGACDSDCGCISDPGTRAGVIVAQHVTLSAKPVPAIACTLSAPSVTGRMIEWQRLLAHVVRRRPIDAGVRCEFAADVSTQELMRLVTAEQHCCQFFRFSITIDDRGLALEVRAPVDASPIVAALFGEPS